MRSSHRQRATRNRRSRQFLSVVDVNNNPNNPIINIRSLAKIRNRYHVWRWPISEANRKMAYRYRQAFSGHGDTSTDSHMELPTIDVDRARLDKIEFPSFRAAIDGGVGAVMSAHIYLPKLEDERDCLRRFRPKSSRAFCATK